MTEIRVRDATNVTFETDWVASRPVFYNELTGRVSDNINDVIDFEELEFDPAGLRSFLDFGYCVFQRTPIRHVRFLRHCTRLTVSPDGSLTVEELEDPVDAWIGKQSTEEDAWELVRSTVQKWESAVSGDIIIPTSGGYDSRLLNLAVRDKTRIRSYTYGLSRDPERSSEVVYARRLAEILGTRWEHIRLGNFHHYFDDWHRLFGISTHAHGMYQMEFYDLIRRRIGSGAAVLSGINGGGWSGQLAFDVPTSPADVLDMGYTHGLRADSQACRLPYEDDLCRQYLERNRERLREPLFRIVEAVRMKNILLHYLMRVPKAMGFRPWSPFEDPNIALTMLTLPAHRRERRVWQRDLFKKFGVDLESSGLASTAQNVLNRLGAERIPVRPLNPELLRSVIDPDYVREINRNVAVRGVWPALNRLSSVRGFGAMLRLAYRFRDWSSAYGAYLTLRAIEATVIQSMLRKGERLDTATAIGGA